MRARLRPFAPTLAKRNFSTSLIQAAKFNFTYEERNQLLAGRETHPLLKGSATEIIEITTKFNELEHEQPPSTPSCTIRGRVQGVRHAGRGLVFADIAQDGSKIQVVVNNKKADISSDEQEVHRLLRPGDAVSAVGQPWRTKSGELSVLASEGIKLLSPCLHPLMGNETGDTMRQHNRVAELKSFQEARQVLLARDVIIAHIQQWMRQKGFMQVQTPILSSQVGGASADPFVTKEDLTLRVAPELWLKRLIIGGFDKVFELGPSFRNEGIDATHNPEFTTCEFYQAFADLDSLVATTKDLLLSTMQALADQCPQYKEYIDPLLAAKWKQFDFFETIESVTGKPLPEILDRDHLVPYMTELGLDSTGNASKLLDRLCGTYIEPLCEGPSFIMNHPSVMAPLAKQTVMTINGKDREVSRRFELLIASREYVNAYEEENDPRAQYEKLLAQAQEQGSNVVPDMQYVEAMEWGLPPTGGWGMGVDRLVMLLTNSKRIHQVLAFGGINQVDRQ